MPADPSRRARALPGGYTREATFARVLGALNAVLVLGLAGISALLISLLVNQGRAIWPADYRLLLPAPVAARAVAVSRDLRLVDAGLLPLAAGLLDDPSPPDLIFGRALAAVVRAIPPLGNNFGALASLLSLGLALMLILAPIEAARRAALASASTRVAEAIRRQIHRQMYRLGQSSLPTEGVGPVVNLFTREANDVRDGLLVDLDVLPRMPILAAGLIAVALGISWTSTIFLGSLGGLVWLISRVIQRSGANVGRGMIRESALQLFLLQEDLGLLRTVRVYGMENVDKQRFEEHLENHREAESTRIAAEHGPGLAIVQLYGVAAALIVGLLGYAIFQGRHTPAGAITLAATLAGLALPILGWARLNQSRRQADRSAAAIFEMLDRRPELQQEGGAQFLPPARERITFENVTLESVSGRVLLDGVSVEVPANSKTAIMGLDEDAKHALVCLIPRLIDPKVGRVRIDGRDLRDVTLESIRAQVATVLQADLIFSDTILANIGLGDPSFSLPRVIEAAKIAHAHHFIQDLPHGYDTIIGPLGHYLTTVEQYRLALARAYLHDPSIVIIEEPSSPMDDETKHLVDDTIARLAPNRTLIFLPHRLSTIRSCDRVIILNGGRVDVAGPPRALQGESKLFRHLQYVEFNQFATGDIEAGQMNG